MDLANRLLEKHGVAVVPGVAFGSLGEGFIRVTYVKSPEETRRGLDRLKEGLRQ